MYFQLTEALSRRFIDVLRVYWMHHPKHRDLVENIQGKFSFKERPQKGIIVKVSGGNHTTLSADNFKGTVYSYVHLTKVKDKPGFSVEWVREDGVAIQNNGGLFPSHPGIYYIEVVEDPNRAGKTAFYVDPLLDVYHEQVSMLDTQTGMLQHPPLAGTPRIYEMPAGYLLEEGVSYTLDLDEQSKPTGRINLASELTTGRWLVADYRYPGESNEEPYPIYEQQANNMAIPGVVMAFGRRVEAGDQLAVVVEEVRRPAALEYGGRWSINLDFDVTARDVFDQREILDQSAVYLWGVARSYLSTEGIEITEISLGGESEDIYDETGDDYFFNGAFSMTVETEWSIFVPLDVWIRQATPLTVEMARHAASLSDEEVAALENNIKVLETLGLESFRDPFWSGRKGTFEIIR